MVSEQDVGELPNCTSLPQAFGAPPETELNHICILEQIDSGWPQLDNGRKYVRVGAATTNEQFRRWCIAKGRVTLPANVIMVEITLGGSNAPIW